MRIRVELTQKRISPSEVLSTVADDMAGGTVVFVGTVRGKSRGMRIKKMELEAATELAKADLTRIARLVGRKHNVQKISIVHRIGRLSVGDAIVVIAVSASHRNAAFEACRTMIDELKKTTPIWKKEIGAAGDRWVEQEA